MAEEEDQDTKTILTPDEYQNRLVDFYSQTLGATGIDAGDDDDADGHGNSGDDDNGDDDGNGDGDDDGDDDDDGADDGDDGD